MAQPYGGGAPAQAPPPAMQPTPVPPSRMGLGTVLGIAALALAVIALVVAAVFPGPVGPAGAAGANGANGATGATGPQGPAGPAGAGTLMNYTQADPWASGGLSLSGCTNILVLNITVPRAGTIVVTQSAHLWIEHATGTTDTWVVNTAMTTSVCGDSNTSLIAWDGDIPSAWASASLTNEAGAVTNAFPVAAAGTYTFYLNGIMLSGQSAGDRVSEASLLAVFYPA